MSTKDEDEKNVKEDSGKDSKKRVSPKSDQGDNEVKTDKKSKTEKEKKTGLNSNKDKSKKRRRRVVRVNLRRLYLLKEKIQVASERKKTPIRKNQIARPKRKVELRREQKKEQGKERGKILDLIKSRRHLKVPCPSDLKKENIQRRKYLK